MVNSRITLLFIAFFLAISTGLAHEIRPGLLQVNEVGRGIYNVTWKVPALGDRVIRLIPVFPEGFEPAGPSAPSLRSGAYIEQLTLSSQRGESLFGKEILLEGLSALQIDVMVQMEFLDGSTLSALVQPKDPVFRVPERGSKAQVAGSYFTMGVEHILGGIDHLLFVLALMLIVTGTWKLLKTITAFTVAHSITLALASLGMVNVPSAPTEAVIALSIVFLCVEIIRSRQGEKSLTEMYPWIVAMAFGLFHGLGFAGALSEVGLPQHEILLALFMFNIGVEAGQILFVLVVLAIGLALKRINLSWPEWSWKVIPYAIGSIAAFWVVQRTISFL